jgi:hypothetical protein
LQVYNIFIKSARIYFKSVQHGGRCLSDGKVSVVACKRQHSYAVDAATLSTRLNCQHDHPQQGNTDSTAALPARLHCQQGRTVSTATLKHRHCHTGKTATSACGLPGHASDHGCRGCCVRRAPCGGDCVHKSPPHLSEVR